MRKASKASLVSRNYGLDSSPLIELLNDSFHLIAYCYVFIAIVDIIHELKQIPRMMHVKVTQNAVLCHRPHVLRVWLSNSPILLNQPKLIHGIQPLQKHVLGNINGNAINRNQKNINK